MINHKNLHKTCRVQDTKKGINIIQNEHKTYCNFCVDLGFECVVKDNKNRSLCVRSLCKT